MKTLIELEIVDNEVKSVKVVTPKKVDDGTFSEYGRIFDERNPNWMKDPEYNNIFIRQQQAYANDLLKFRGYLFLNEVYDMLGFPRSKAGQCVGWVYDEKNPVGDNYVDFNLLMKCNHNFINGYEKSPLLDFNVDGCILEFVEKEEAE